ncbi:flippase [Pedobacter insulae]|uniref:Membrane protein involved in the export of O-antigen and teichoic acid n=1 Tax=Pedobacter insulae TaxID=414048 RepID=A0A1I2TAB7_9SPHI|nr:flippase [Pedobacter insulae]SFG60187.1 Membrane protein involved in the export of O-antigen and teichoic acid [Pedobacter insulae]
MKLPAIKGFDEEAFYKYLKNTGWLMFGKILSLIVGLAIARYLGPASFGDLSFAVALVGITGAIGALGLDTFIIREIINEPSKKDEILGTSLWMRLATNALLIPVTLIIYLTYHHLSAQPGTTLTLYVALLACTSLFQSFNIIDAYFQSQVKSKYVVHVQNICLVISSIIKIGILILKLPLLYIVLALFFDALILAIGLMIIYQRKGGNITKWTFSKQRAISLLKKSFPLILSAVMVSIYMKIDAIMLKTVGSVAVGIYSAAAKISEAWYFIPVAIVTSVFPALINARKTDMQRYQKRLMNLYDLLVYISLPVALFISVFANQLIHLIYADKYEGAGIMLSIHIWSGLFVFLGSASSQYLLAEGYTKIAFYRTLTGAVINILLNVWLIPKYAGTGASVATLIACFVSCFYILLIPKTRKQGIMMLKSLFLVSLFQKIVKR